MPRNKEKWREYCRKYCREHRAQIRQNARRYEQKVRFEVLSHYSSSKPKCAICGNVDLLVLTVDHINNDGAEHRRELKHSSSGVLYHWLKRNNYPKGFQILCQNCNIRKYRLEQIVKDMEQFSGL